MRDGDHSLSPVYREALRLQAAGHDDEAIAAALDVTVEAVPALLLLARRKRARAEPDRET
jgi:DNA-directed RNA polymerase specialized sigma24 family protein